MQTNTFYGTLAHVLTMATMLVVLIPSAHGCFIRNCPPGGKRSMDLVSRASVPCLQCGPGGLGQCVGPQICCGPFGCYISTAEAEICAKEDERGMACEVRGEPCGARGQGSCVANGICCDSKACSMNERCRRASDEGGVQLITLLNRILEGGDLE
ncbi:conopressin/neurophysin-like [Mya arenaria]|uniref:conopressin/neurophysin-like n=1 Tax=Mya arenaria TaxID=6604 RepID=UPI0022E5F8F1|nr:conopressin/neurophysin-like [Mya arenaria]